MQRLRALQAARDQDAFAGAEQVCLSSQRQWHESRQTAFCYRERQVELGTGFAGAYELSPPGSPVGNQVSLDEDAAIGQIHTIDDAMGAFFHNVRLARCKPLIERQAAPGLEHLAKLLRNRPMIAACSMADE